MAEYRRSGDAFYKLDEAGITKIEPDSNLDYYQYVGLTGENPLEVEEYDVIEEGDWDAVLDDVKECARVGSRPNIPPPPGE